MNDLQAYRIKAAKTLSDIILDWKDQPAPVSDGKVDSLLRELAGLPARPEVRQPYEGLFKLPEEAPSGVVAKAQFTMYLGWSSKILWGRLIFFDAAGNQLLNRAATSGQPGYQTEDHFWERGLGPIPPGDYELSTEPYWCPELPGVEGWWHDILPWDVYGPNGQSRSAFGLHWDSNPERSVGSAGCPVVQAKIAMQEATNSLREAKAAGFKSIPFKVVYPKS